MSLGKTLDRWRSARQLRNTRLTRMAAQETARNTRLQGGSADAYAQGHHVGWEEGWRAGYQRGWRDRDAGHQDATAREGPPA